MTNLLLIGILFFLSMMLSFPLTRKPLSEDEGMWYYLAVFSNRGLRLHKNFLYPGYFGIPMIASVVYNCLGNGNIKSFQYFKAVWYSLTAISIYWLTYCFSHDTTFSFIATLIFAIITAIPNTLFVLTYGEHFFILPINLSIIFTYCGFATGSFWYFILAGIMSAWAVQMKITSLLFSILLPGAFFFSTNMFLSIVCYTGSFIGFNLFPLVLFNKLGRESYLLRTFTPIITLLIIVLDKLKLRFLSKHIPESLRTYDQYVKNLYDNTIHIQWLSFKRFIMPAIQDLYLILILAACQALYMFIKFDYFIFSITLLLIVFVITQQAQKNYYTPHINPCWCPISILAAKTICDIWPYFLNGGPLGWIIIVLFGFGLTRIGIIIYKSFRKSERDSFGHLDPLFGKVFRLCESVGEYIQENSNKNEKLFVWGDQPSLYLYARREIFDSNYLLIYAHQGKVFMENKLLESLRMNTPALLIFYNYKIIDGWNMDRLKETIGIPYNLMKSFQVTDDRHKSSKSPQGICFDFPLYRRDDEKYKEILLDRAINSESNNDPEEAHKHLTEILELFPDNLEAQIRLSFLDNKVKEITEKQRYINERSAMNNEPIIEALLLRLLAEIDADTGDLDSAIENYDKALNLNPDDFRIYNGLGELCFSRGKIEEAFEFFKKAVSLHAYSADVCNNLGVILSQEGESTDAVKCFKKALSIMPTHPDAINNIEAFYPTTQTLE